MLAVVGGLFLYFLRGEGVHALQGDQRLVVDGAGLLALDVFEHGLLARDAVGQFSL